MGLDYYAILNVKFEADIFEIQEAFRRAVIKYFTSNKPMLCFVCEAYEVLSDPGYRALYNHFGEEGLKSGILTQPYVFHGQPMRTVQVKEDRQTDMVYRENYLQQLWGTKKFFGTLNPLEFVFKRVYKYDTLQIKQVLLPPILRQKDPPMYKELLITLEEVYFGGHKDLLFYRQEYDVEKGMVTKDVSLKVTIAKGIMTGTKLVFRNQSHQGPVNIPGDVIVTINERPHERFLRSGSNLIQRVHLTLKEAFIGTIVLIETLDGRKLRVRIFPPLSFYWSKTVDREGLPISGEPDKKGDLILTVDIKMPIKVTKSINELITNTLELAEEKGMFYDEPDVGEADDNVDRTDPCNMKADYVKETPSCS